MNLYSLVTLFSTFIHYTYVLIDTLTALSVIFIEYLSELEQCAELVVSWSDLLIGFIKSVGGGDYVLIFTCYI